MIQVDSREQNNSHIIAYFVRQGIPFIRSKMWSGDYCDFNHPQLVIERKASILELANNLGNKHAEFKAEILRLEQVGGRMILLIEETTPIETWTNHRSDMKGDVMKKQLDTMQSKYPLTVMQCHRSESGEIISKLLGEI